MVQTDTAPQLSSLHANNLDNGTTHGGKSSSCSQLDYVELWSVCKRAALIVGFLLLGCSHHHGTWEPLVFTAIIFPVSHSFLKEWKCWSLTESLCLSFLSKWGVWWDLDFQKSKGRKVHFSGGCLMTHIGDFHFLAKPTSRRGSMCTQPVLPVLITTVFPQ